MNSQVKIKAEQIARMIIAGRKATQIALDMNMSYGGLQRVLACPEYKLIEDDVRRNNLNKMDASLAERAKLTKELEDAVPDAMKALIDAVKQKKDLRMQLAAAREVLDRDPRRIFTRSTARSEDANATASRPDLPNSVLDTLVKEADATRDVLLRAPISTSKPAEA